MQDIQRELRILCLKLAHQCRDGNLQSAFSSIDAIWALYDGILDTPRGDTFVIGKGQAVLALYAVMIKKGILDESAFTDIGKFDSPFSNQIDMTKAPGFANSTGSLGHGLPIAVGRAMANQIKQSPAHTHVLVGDGEFMEGTMWESCLLASSKRLTNLHVIIDNNFSAGAMLDMGSLTDKLHAFGFTVWTVRRGTNPSSIAGVLSATQFATQPTAVILQSQRGYGSPSMMTDPIWFHKAPDAKELRMLIKEVEDYADDIS